MRKMRAKNPDGQKEKQKQYYQINSDKIKISHKTYREKNKEKLKKKNKKYRLENPMYYTIYTVENKHRIKIKWRSRYLINRYGLSQDNYLDMLQAQNNCCAICKKHKTRRDSEYLCVDHCHATGEVRGLLCIRCNTLLGFYEKRKTQNTDEHMERYLETARQSLCYRLKPDQVKAAIKHKEK